MEIIKCCLINATLLLIYPVATHSHFSLLMCSLLNVIVRHDLTSDGVRASVAPCLEVM